MVARGRSETTCESKRGATSMSKCRIFDPTNGRSWELNACRLNRELRRGMIVPLVELVPAAPPNLGIYVKLAPYCGPAERLHIAELAAALVAAAVKDTESAKERRPARAARYGHVVPRRPKRTKLNAHGWGFAEVGCAAIGSEEERAIEKMAFAGEQKGEKQRR